MAFYRFAYIALFAAALAFSQIYAGHLSSVVFITVMILPAVSLLLTIASRFSLSVTFDTSPVAIEKNKNLNLRVVIKNKFIFPCTSVCIFASMPGFAEQKNARLIFSMLPFQKKSLNLTYQAKYRGEYEMSLDTAYFFDYLKIFRLKKTLSLKKNILVTPRIIEAAADKSMLSSVDDEPDTTSSLASNDGERSFTRKYTDGDDIRRIHWKLSSKQEDYMVWQTVNNMSELTLVICDMSEHSDNPSENIIYTDAVLEAALSLSFYNLKKDIQSVICYHDPTENKTENIPISHLSQLYDAASHTARAKTYSGEPSYYYECKKQFGEKSGGAVTVLITHRGDSQLAKLAEEISTFSRVNILLTGEADEGVEKYINTMRNVRIASVNPDKMLSQLPEAINRIYKI